MSIAEQIELIQRSRINLNFGACCEYGAPVASDFPERCYWIPACAGFLLCDKSAHALDNFSIWENWTDSKIVSRRSPTGSSTPTLTKRATSQNAATAM